MGGKDLEMVDVDSQQSAEPSLQKLKSLDSLPDLKSQLRTANEFCNHGHRAEMILKWLTTKLQKDEKAVLNVEAWALLEHCFRLVAPQKMGILLARFDLLATAQKAVQGTETKKLQRTLNAITSAVETLEEISAGADGAQVKQLLSADGASAASLLGVWTGRVSELLHGATTSGEKSPDVVRLTLPVFRLWTLRKPASSDNDEFAKNCLAPCAVLLQQLSSATLSGASNKRRRGAQDQTIHEADLMHDLEVLIARHIFLPARSSFFQTQDKESSESTPSELAGKLESIKVGIAGQDVQTDHLCEALPNVLDVALRCIPMTTSRQRSKERPWVEKVFQELLACLDDGGKLKSQTSVVGMLKVIGNRASLPTTMLKELVQQYSGLSVAEGSGPVDFALIAEAVALDPTVFVEEETANQLFPALTKATESLEKSSDSIGLLVDSITKPVMRAFANSRRFETFVKKWQQQLLAVNKSASWTVWTELDDVAAELLELHLIADQVQNVLDVVTSSAQTGEPSSKKSKKDSSPNTELSSKQHKAAAVVLHALLKGVKSEEYAEELQSRLETLLRDDLELVQESKVKSISSHVWLMFSLVFKLWFPRWAIATNDADAVSKKARKLLSHAAVDSIMKAKASGKDVSAAETFVGLLCSHLQDYEGCRELTSGLVVRLAQPSTTQASPVFLAFPGLLALLDKDGRQAIIADMVDQAVQSSGTSEVVGGLEALAALVHSALHSPNMKLADEVISAILKAPNSDKKDDDHLTQEHAVLDLLLQIPASALARGQRERILNWASDHRFTTDADEARVSKIFALMVQLMNLPNATANICTDASTIWTLCRSAGSSKKSKSGKEKKSSVTTTSNIESVAALGELVHSVCAYLLATQDQERSRAMLKSLVETAVQEMDSFDFTSGSACDSLAVIKTVLRDTDSGAGTGMLSHLAGNAASTILQFGEAALKEAQSSIKALKKQDDAKRSVVVPSILLDLLVCLRKSSVVGATFAKHDAALTKLCNKILTRSSEEDGSVVKVSQDTSALSVPAFSLLAHLTGFEACTSLGEALLGSSISSKSRQLLVDELKALAKSSPASDQLAVLNRVAPETQDLSAQSIAVLQNSLSAVTKVNVTKDERTLHTLYIKLLETLQQTKDFATYTAAVACLLTTIRDKPFILNQHLTEATLQTVQTLARSSPAERLIYLDLCSILSALLLHHRARLQGRFHLLTATLQALQTRLFTPAKPTKDQTRRALAPRHARAYTRLLTLLCNPPTRTHKESAKHTDLIDSARRARAHVGQFVPTLLHAFCAQILAGQMGEGMREALTPGLWAVVEAMEVQSPDAVKALSAGMNNSERAVLRSVYEDWKRFGKWEGA
ncbi:hypothetical protein Q7P37_003573 [Cladosporium fusiforme]